MKSVIFAGFDGEDNPARLLTESVSAPCKKVIMPNDKALSATLMQKVVAKDPSAVIMTGQKPSICSKIAVERFARAGSGILKTSVDCIGVARFFRENGYDAYMSSGAGNSYCNAVYAEVLKIYPRGLFLHIPTMENISDFGELVRVFDKFIQEFDFEQE